MKRLPLYNVKGYPIDRTDAVEREDECTRCWLGESVAAVGRKTCIPPVGQPGGVLILGEWPSRDDDRIGRLGTGAGPVWVRNTVRAALDPKVPISFATALGCSPSNDARVRVMKKFDPAKFLDACRPHLKRTLEETRPQRIIAIGQFASYALTGEKVYSLWLRRAHGFVEVGGRRVPVFIVPSIRDARMNRFQTRRVEADLKWASTAEPEPAPFDALYHLVETEADAREAVDRILRSSWSVFDCETAGRLWDPSFRVLDVGVTVRGARGDADAWPTWVWGEKALANDGARKELARYLRSQQPKHGSNVKYDVNTVIAGRIVDRVTAVGGDTRLDRKLLEPESSGALADMAWLVGMGGTKDEQKTVEAEVKEWLAKYRRAKAARAKMLEFNAAVLSGKEKLKSGKPKKLKALKPEAQEAIDRWLDFEFEDPELAAYVAAPHNEFDSYSKALVPAVVRDAYNARDCVGTARLRCHLDASLKEFPDTIDRIRREIVEPAQVAVQRVEQWGIQVSMGALEAFEIHCDKRLGEVTTELEKIAGVGFNADSWQQVGRLLYDRLRLPAPDDRSTDKDALEPLLGKHPAVQLIMDTRKYTKLQGTYARGMRPHVRHTGRIHPSILLDGARSGRTSSENPNGQNIPKPETREGVMARGIFVASPGRILVSLDYSQIELRVAAALSGDPLMNEIFAEGVDYHQRTAELVSQVAWGIPPEAVEKKHRSASKTINFGVLYGMSDAALAHKLKCSIQEATRIREAIMGRFAVLDTWIAERKAEAMKTGYTWTHWGKGMARGRRRPLFDVASSDTKMASRAMNGAANTPVQGTASEFCIASLAGCVEWIQDSGLEEEVALVLPVHDQLLFDVEKEHLQRTINTAREIMLGWDSWGTPIAVDCEIGPSWGALEKVEYNSSEGAWVRKEKAAA